MLKGYASLKTARRSLLIQVLGLILIVVAICLIGRIAARNRFDMDLIIAYDDEVGDESNLTVQWEKEGGIPIQSMRLRDMKEDSLEAKALHLSMMPEEPGDYKMNILDKEGHILGTDSIHVDAFHTGFSWSTGAFTGNEAVIAASIVFYAGLMVITLIHFLKLKSPLFCSYNAILSAGIFLFCVVAVLINLPIYVRHLRTPAFYPTWQLLADIAAGGRNFVFMTYPLVVIFSLLLIVSNIELLRHERPRIQNMLGLLLGLTMIFAVLAYSYYFMYLKSFMESHEVYKVICTVENVLGIVLTYGECILLSSVFCALRASLHIPMRNMDYVLILGCGFRKDGTLPPLLKGRVDKALEFWHRQKAETGKEAIIIPSGGQGANECMAESEAMYRYIVSTGFPVEAVIKEDRSANTYQNMAFSKKIIDAREAAKAKAGSVTASPMESGSLSLERAERTRTESTAHNPRIAYVTTNYHVFRSGIWAQLAELPAEGLGSKTKWWFWPNAFVRECAGLLRNRIVPELILLVLITVAVALISYFAL